MSSETVAQIKSRISIAEVVGTYLRLQPAGRNLRTRCPFHDEKTPSFFVSPERQSFYCFGCHQGGDIFTFVEEMEGVDFLGALKILAERAGVELQPTSPERRDELEQLRAVMAAAAKFYVARLADLPAGAKYLASRGLVPETVARFDLGLAPAGWTNLVDFALTQGFTPSVLVRAGLAGSKTDDQGRVRYYDRFRSRIMFPLRDSAGRVVGFSGRIVGPAADDPANAKYINSPETALYAKSKLLYGFDLAKSEIRRRDVAVLVEGQMDLVMAHQAGTPNAVAVSGTALSLDHLSYLKRLSPNLVLAFDADPAGLLANRRALAMALGAGFEVKIAALAPGTDPADCIQTDPDEWLKTVAAARPVIDFWLDELLARGTDRRTLASDIRAEIFPLLAHLPRRTDGERYLGVVAGLMGASEAAVAADLADWQKANVDVLAGPMASRASTGQPPAPASRQQRIEEKLAGLWWAADQAARGSLLALIQPVVGQARWQSLLAGLAGREPELALAAQVFYPELTVERLCREFDELLDQWQLSELRDQLRESSARLARAERAGQTAEVAEFLKECQNISDCLQQLKNAINQKNQNQTRDKQTAIGQAS